MIREGGTFNILEGMCCGVFSEVGSVEQIFHTKIRVFKGTNFFATIGC